MGTRLAADAVLVVHFIFIVFAVAGATLVLRWPWVAWLHLPSVAWAVVVEWMGWICPLTPLENILREAAGQRGYEGGFLEHYLWPLIYPAGLSRGVQFALGGAVLLINVAAYAALWRRRAHA